MRLHEVQITWINEIPAATRLDMLRQAGWPKRRVGKLMGLAIDLYTMPHGCVEYVLMDPAAKIPVGTVFLVKQPDGASQERSLVLNPDLRGQGIPLALYRWLLTSQKLTLLSDGEHSPGTQKLWTNLWRDPTVRVTAIKDSGETAEVEDRDGVLYANDEPVWKSDWLLLARAL